MVRDRRAELVVVSMDIFDKLPVPIEKKKKLGVAIPKVKKEDVTEIKDEVKVDVKEGDKKKEVKIVV